ncbi:MAG: hypothetical protein DRJ40_09640 [Thermoprotei archaeon]|nr:MAG: hypothetical protein DRJ40_09640 [Thermoprotei archaeon]
MEFGDGDGVRLGLLPVTVYARDLVDYLICPHRIYLRRYLYLRGVVTEYMSVGGEVHKLLYMYLQGRDVGRELVRYGIDVGKLREVYSELRKLGDVECEVEVGYGPLAGSIDLLAGGVPVEVKYSTRPRFGDVVQLAFYVLLLELSKGRNISRGYLLYLPSCNLIEIKVESWLKRLVLEFCKEVQLIKLGLVDSSPRSRRACKGCELGMYCKFRGEGGAEERSLASRR